MKKCKRCEILEKLLKAKDELLICYRIQKKPPERLWNDLERYKKQLEQAGRC